MSDACRDVDVVHRLRSPYYHHLSDDMWFPANHSQVRDLLGRLLTQLDALGLSERAHRAAKALTVREVWRWWDEVAENAVTSGAGCLAPIVMTSSGPGDDRPPSNRWGWASENEYLASVGQQKSRPFVAFA